MNKLKSIREQLGFTQKSLAEKTGLSLRTIQRLEAGNNPPKGHSLQVLSDVLNVNPTFFAKTDPSPISITEEEIVQIKFLNLFILLFFILPFGNLIGTIWYWRKKRASPIVNEMGKKIINVQIIWSILLSISLCITPFFDTRPDGHFPYILIVLFVALGINLFIIGYTAYSIQRYQFDILNFPIRLL